MWIRLVGILLLSAAASAQSQPPTPGPGDTNRQSQTQRDGEANVSPNVETPSYPPITLNVSVVAPTVPTAPQPNENSTPQHPSDWGSVADWVGNGVNASIALVTLALWIVAKNQFVKQARQTHKSLVLTRKQLALTKESTDLMLTLNQQWLSIDKWEIDHRPGDSEIKLWFSFRNDTNMAVTITGYWVERVDVATNELVVIEGERKELPPKQSYSGFVSIFLDTEEKVRQYSASHMNVMVVGIVDFIDAFGREREQEFGVFVAYGMSRKAFRPIDASMIKGLLTKTGIGSGQVKRSKDLARERQQNQTKGQPPPNS